MIPESSDDVWRRVGDIATRVLENLTLRNHKTASDWLSPAQVSKTVPGMTVTLLQRMRDAGRGPRYAKPSPKTVVYDRSDVDDYVRSTIVGTKDQP